MPQSPASAVPAERRRLITATPFVWRHPSEIPPRAWLYGRHFIRSFLSATVAPGAIGKSSLLLCEAVAMAAGRDLLGSTPHAPLRVWYWNGEDPLSELERRIAAICLFHAIDPSAIQGRLYVDSGRSTELIIASETPGGAIVHQALVDDLISEIKAKQIDVLIVDPFITSHSVRENDNGQIGLVAKTYARIADSTHCAVELVHHVRKSPGGVELTADDARGAGALVAAARSVRVLNVMTKAESDKVSIEKRRQYFRTDNAKTNLAPPAAAKWYHLASVSLANTSADYAADEVAVVEQWKWPDPFADLTVQDLRSVQKRIMGNLVRYDSQAADWVGNIVADELTINASDVAGKAKIKAIIEKWIENGMLRVVTKPDKRRRPRKYVEVGTIA